MIYQVTDEKTLEEVCFRFYGRSDAIIDVLKQRPELSFLGRVLEQGTRLDLPEFAVTSVTANVVRLWE